MPVGGAVMAERAGQSGVSIQPQMDSVQGVSGSSEVYERLFAYDFRANKKFINGWNQVKNIIPKETQQESLLKAQVFFYSREVEPVDLAAYKQWLSSNGRSIPHLDSFISIEEVASPVVTNCQSSDDMPVTSDKDHTGQHPTNFMELIGMIQQGVKLPGMEEELNVQPTNEEPTQSALQRPRKPWEIGT